MPSTDLDALQFMGVENRKYTIEARAIGHNEAEYFLNLLRNPTFTFQDPEGVNHTLACQSVRVRHEGGIPDIYVINFTAIETT
jgi:hypothetical protein